MKKKLIVALIGLLFIKLVSAVTPNAPVSLNSQRFEQNVGQIISPGPNIFEINVSGADNFLWDLDLMVSISHPSNGDLLIQLTSPIGETTVISSNNAMGHINVFENTLFDDQANEFITEFNFIDFSSPESLVPEGALGKFVGTQVNGIWTLEIVDQGVGNIGTFIAWSLDVSSFEQGSIANYSDSNNNFQTIPNGGQVQSLISLPETLEHIISASVNVNIEAPDAYQISTYLQSPLGTLIPLALENGSNEANVYAGTNFANTNDTPITDMPFLDGITITNAQPLGSFSQAQGEPLEQEWQLIVMDQDDPNATEASLVSWSIEVETLSALPETDVSIQKQVIPVGSADFVLGGQALYTITVENVSMVSAENVVVEDLLPLQTVFVSDNCGGSTMMNQWEWIVGNLAPGELISCDILVDTTEAGLVINTATVSTDTVESNLLNNQASAQYIIDLSAQQVPINSRLGLILMLLLITYFSSHYFKVRF